MRIRFVYMALLVFLGFASFSFAQIMPSSGGGSTPALSGGSAFTPSSDGGSGSSSNDTATGGGGTTTTTTETGGSTSSTGGSTTSSSGGGTGVSSVPSADTADAAFTDWTDTGDAYDFQNEIQDIQEQKKKKKKTPTLISVFGKLADIVRSPFTGNILGANWRVGGVTNDPTAQGTLTGKGSLLRILIKLYTGSVYAQFDSRVSHWMASFYTDGDAERSELYNGTAVYQEETTTDAEGAERKIGLLLSEKTLFGMYDSGPASPMGGSFFIVDGGAMPDAVLNANAIISIPQGTDPFIPAEKIIKLVTEAGIAVRDLFVTMAHAATQTLMPSQIFTGLTKYKSIQNDMARIEEQFNAFNFDDPDVDLDKAQELVDAYDAKQNQLYTISNQLGWRGQPFVRDGAWLTAAGSAADALFEGGVPSVPAIFLSELEGSFDFYVVADNHGAQAVFGGSCAGQNNADTGEEVACVMRKVFAAQSRAILNASEKYGARADEMHGKLNDIEAALFSPAE